MARAEKYLSAGNSAEAIKSLRKIAEDERPERWFALLKSAYQMRMRQLAGKGMAKEALFLYDNMVRFCRCDDHPLLIHLHFILGKYAEGYAVYLQNGESFCRRESQRVEESLSSFLLADEKPDLGFLPQDSPVRKYFSLAAETLQAFCCGEPDQVTANLKQIPLRSPYGTFKLVIKAMLLHEENDIQSAGKIFRGIRRDSPFYVLAAPYLSLACYGKEVSQTALSEPAVETEAALTGVTKKEKKFLGELEKYNGDVSRLYNFLMRNSALINDDLLRRACGLLLPNVPGKVTDFSKRFGFSDSCEYHRLFALAAEKESDFSTAVSQWLEVVKTLREGEKNSKKIALVYSRCAGFFGRSYLNIKGSEREYYRMALEADPGDRDLHIKLIGSYEEGNNKRYILINDLYKKFPDDPVVMSLTIEAALRRGAFKKSSGIAAKLLRLDPVNRALRIQLINAHLSHAAKLVDRKRMDLAKKECETAMGYERNNLVHGKVHFFMGCLEIMDGEEKVGSGYIEQGMAACGHEITGRFLLSVTGKKLTIGNKWQKRFDRELRLSLRGIPAADDLLRILPFLEMSKEAEDGWEHGLKTVSPWLKKWRGDGLTLDDLLRFCRVFDCCDNYRLLELFGRKAMAFKPPLPIAHYYMVLGKSRRGTKKISSKEFDRLVESAEIAELQGDMKTVQLLDDLLDELYFSFDMAGSSSGSSSRDGFLDYFSDLLGEDQEEMEEKHRKDTLSGVEAEKKKGAKSGKKNKPIQLNLFE